jgi:hypothetical protein
MLLSVLGLARIMPHLSSPRRRKVFSYGMEARRHSNAIAMPVVNSVRAGLQTSRCISPDRQHTTNLHANLIITSRDFRRRRTCSSGDFSSVSGPDWHAPRHVNLNWASHARP